MRSIVRRCSQVTVLVVLLLALCMVGARPVSAAGNFVIKQYDVKMTVNEDDTYDVIETLDVHFTADSHGIYKTIPYLVTLDRDGQKSRFFAKVRDFRMLSGQPVKKIKGDEAYMFKIGDPDKYAATDTRYKLRYTFDMRGDHLDGADEVYYNIIGTRWEAQSIDRVSYRITFPQTIDMSKVGIKTGDQTRLEFQTEGDRVVKGTTDAFVLNGLTIRAVLPEGYFSRQATANNIPFYIVLGLMVLGALWGILMWRRHGLDPDVVETEEFYPPDGLSAPEIAYLENEDVSGEQITSMLLTLADKGFVRIVEESSTKKKRKTQYRIERVKLYDGDNALEHTFMEGLFENAKTGEDGTVYVKKKDLDDSFYTTVEEIKSQINDAFKDRLYDEKAGNYAFLLGLIGVVLYAVLWFVAKISNGSPFVTDDEFAVYLALDALQVLLPIFGFWGIGKRIMRGRKNPFGYLGWVILILIGYGGTLLFNSVMGKQIPLFLAGMGLCLLLFVVGGLCERKTDYYAAMLGKIRGFKRFLQVAEKDRIDMLAEQDPGYYYKTLAFAFALGVTAVYAKRFASLAKQPPEWYSTPYYYGAMSGFDPVRMTDDLSGAMHGFSNSMTSSPGSDGGGGGFSGGGGAGGGGGGSW